MKRIIPFLLIFSLLTVLTAEEVIIDQSPFNVELISSHTERTVIEYSFGSFSRQPVDIAGDIYYHLTLENEPAILREGEPALPYINRSIIISGDALNDVRVIFSEYIDYEMAVAPSKGLIYRNQNLAEIPYTFSETYQKDSFFPANLAELGAPYILRDFRGQIVSVNPFQYNPVSGILRVYNRIRVEINRIGVDTHNVLVEERDGYTRDFETVYENRFLNFSTLRYSPLEEQGRMIVIAHDAFVDAVMPYVNWKNQKGVPTDIYPVSEIGNDSGSIMSFIQAEYDLNDGLVFVQLAGDAAQVAPNSYSSNASDPAYSLLAGADPYADIFIGRFSAETAAQVANQVEKVIHYERDIDTTDTWLSNAMGVASDEGAGIGHGGLSDIQHMNLIRDNLLGYTYTYVDQIYAPSATATDVTIAVDSGRGFANYTGHGSITSWGTTGYSNTQVNALTNDYMLPFIVSVACVNGNFVSYTCFAEAWLRATNNTTGAPTGAVAFYGSSRNQLWQPPMSAQQEITELLVSDQKNTIGGLYYNGSFQMIDDYPSTSEGPAEFLCWHIFGDASLQVRSMAPETMNVSYSSSIPLGVSTLQVSTGVPDALVSLTTPDYEILAYGYTNTSGMITLEMVDPPSQPVNLNLTVTAYNKVTHLGNVEVIPAEGPFVVLDSYTLNGNQPDTPQYDELIDISVTLANVGLDPADNVSATLTTTSEGVTIIDNQTNFGNIAASGSITVNNAFQIETADDLENQTTLYFSLFITSGLDSWTANFNFQLNAPEIEVIDLIIQDPTPGGNNNGMLDPGETVSLYFTVQNAGLAASPAGTAILEINNPLVSISEPLFIIPTIPAGGSTDAVYQLAIDPDIPIGTIVQFTLNIAGGEYSTVDIRNTTVGIVIIEIGEGTSTNTTTQAAPINIYYRSLRGQMVYTADEINAAGYSGQGLIAELGFYVTQTPAYSLPNFIIRMKHTTATNASSHDNGPFETVYSVAQYTPVAGDWDMLTLDEPFQWNGVDNILIDTAFSQVPAWTSSGQQRVFNSPNGFRYTRSDSSDQTNATTTSTASYKPQIKIVFGGTIPTDPYYDVSVTPEQAADNGYNGSVVEYLMTVSNTGNVTDNYNLTVSGNEWDVSFWEAETAGSLEEQELSFLDLGDGIVSMQNTAPYIRSEITETGNITGGSSKSILVKVTIPPGASGNDTATVTVTSQTESEISGSMTLETISLGNDPSIPVEPRYIAEWEPMQGVLIRYPLGIPYSLISALSEETIVYTIVSNNNLNTAMNNYQNNDVNMDNCEFIIASSDTYWTRDYGPWSMATADAIGVVDFDYNRPRPADNQIPSVISNYFSIPYYEMPLTHTGGNMMGDGMGVGASTTLVDNENTPLTPSEVDQHMQNYLGITSYHKIPDPTGEYIQHIDTWAKFLDVDKVMIRSVPTTHSQYTQIEAAADYFADQTSSYGTPYQVYRVYTPNNEPYTNSLIVNNRVYIPIQGSVNDAAAIVSYQEAMPGYEVIGYTGSWASNDALHCRVMGLADQGMLYVNHTPSQINYSGEDIPIEVEIKAYSGQSLISEEILVHWKTSVENPFNQSPLLSQGNDIYIAHIPPQSFGETVYYYISAADVSGRTVRRPFMGNEDPFIIEINEQGIGLEAPEIIGISIEEGVVYISWEAVPGATGYIVETATELGGEFIPDYSGIMNYEDDIVIWQSSIIGDIKLYRVKATLEYPALRQQSPEAIKRDFRE